MIHERQLPTPLPTPSNAGQRLRNDGFAGQFQRKKCVCNFFGKNCMYIKLLHAISDKIPTRMGTPNGGPLEAAPRWVPGVPARWKGSLEGGWSWLRVGCGR